MPFRINARLCIFPDLRFLLFVFLLCDRHLHTFPHVYDLSQYKYHIFYCIWQSPKVEQDTPREGHIVILV